MAEDVSSQAGTQSETGRSPARNRRGTTFADTAAVAFSGAGTGSFVAWLFQCHAAGMLVAPSPELDALMGAALIPFAHAIGKVVLSRLNQLAAKDN